MDGLPDWVEEPPPEQLFQDEAKKQADLDDCKAVVIALPNSVSKELDPETNLSLQVYEL